MKKVVTIKLRGQKNWRVLKCLGTPFYDMDKAIQFVRVCYAFVGCNSDIELRLLDKQGNSLEWDNF